MKKRIFGTSLFIIINLLLFLLGFLTYGLAMKYLINIFQYNFYLTLIDIYRIINITICPASVFSLIFFVVLYFKKPTTKETLEKRRERKIKRLENKIKKLK